MVRLGVSPLIVGHVVNHRGTTKAGMTLPFMCSTSFDKEKREALELWADKLAGIVSGGGAKIIPMHKAARMFDKKSRSLIERYRTVETAGSIVADACRSIPRL